MLGLPELSTRKARRSADSVSPTSTRRDSELSPSPSRSGGSPVARRRSISELKAATEAIRQQELAAERELQARRDGLAARKAQAEYYVRLTEGVAAVRAHLAVGLGDGEDDGEDLRSAGVALATAAVGEEGDAALDAAMAAGSDDDDDGSAFGRKVLYPEPGESGDAYRLRVSRTRTADLVASLHSDEDAQIIAQLNRWVTRRAREAEEEADAAALLEHAAMSAADQPPSGHAGSGGGVLDFAADGFVLVPSLMAERQHKVASTLDAFGRSLNAIADQARARALAALEKAADEAAANGAGQAHVVVALLRAQLRRKPDAGWRGRHDPEAELKSRVRMLVDCTRSRSASRPPAPKQIARAPVSLCSPPACCALLCCFSAPWELCHASRASPPPRLTHRLRNSLPPGPHLARA
jgi:hypothetical protein